MAPTRGHIGQSLRALSSSSSTFLNCNGKTTTAAIFCSRVAAIAHGLRRLGLQDGDRVAIAALNSQYYLEWLLAVSCAGGIFAPLNYRWGTDEANAAIELIQPAVLVLDEHCLNWCKTLKSIDSICTQVYIGQYNEHFNLIHAETIVHSIANPVLELHWAPGDVALICFTSGKLWLLLRFHACFLTGTTSTPKGAALSHNALIVQSLAKLAMVGYSSKDIYLHATPLCHIGGISSALAILMAGSCHVILPKFTPSAVLGAINLHNISAMILVPTMLKDLVEFNKDRSTFPSLTTILNGAGSLSGNIIERMKLIFPKSQVFSAYGMTETCSSLTFLRVHPASEKLQHYGICIGKPAPHVEIVTLHGKILTRGLHVMDGYWGREEETRAVISEDGWLDTGDVGKFDENGNLWLLGRSKDVIKTGAENVYAAEVEAVLARHPSVSMVAVIGLPDSRLCEAVAAAVMLNKGWEWDTGTEEKHGTVSPSILRMHCRRLGLSRYKIPKHIFQQLDPFPLTSTGKIHKPELKLGMNSRL